MSDGMHSHVICNAMESSKRLGVRSLVPRVRRGLSARSPRPFRRRPVEGRRARPASEGRRRPRRVCGGRSSPHRGRRVAVNTTRLGTRDDGVDDRRRRPSPPPTEGTSLLTRVTLEVRCFTCHASLPDRRQRHARWRCDGRATIPAPTAVPDVGVWTHLSAVSRRPEAPPVPAAVSRLPHVPPSPRHLVVRSHGVGRSVRLRSRSGRPRGPRWVRASPLAGCRRRAVTSRAGAPRPAT